MNSRDRDNIAALLDGIASGDLNSQVLAARRLLEHHPKIIEEMQYTDWWEIDPEPEPEPERGSK